MEIEVIYIYYIRNIGEAEEAAVAFAETAPPHVC
jgi:hypothetical protein